MPEVERTFPWWDDEKIVVGSIACVYTLLPGQSLAKAQVHLPGGRTVDMSRINNVGGTVSLPERWRRGL